MRSISISLIVFTMAILISGCAKKTKGKSTSITNGTETTSGTNSSTTTSTGTSSTNNCSDGVARDGATSCYYTNLPRMVFSGPGTYGSTYWSSKTGLPAYVSPNQFRTDATFAVRIKPLYAIGNETSRQGKVCSALSTQHFNKMKVFLMLRRSIDSLGEVKELIGSVNTYSNTARFTVPGGTNDPYILEVIGVTTNHRCNESIYGQLTADQRAACSNDMLLDIPVNTGGPTPCVAFNIEFATDNTSDLPN